MPQKFQKKGGKSKIPTSPRAAELRGENEGKTGKIGIKVVLCEVLAAGERESKVENWDFPKDLGISQGFGNLRDEANPQGERRNFKRSECV